MLKKWQTWMHSNRFQWAIAYWTIFFVVAALAHSLCAPLKYHPSLNEICFSNFASTFDAIHGGRVRKLHHLDHIICLQSLLLTSIMNSCAYFRVSSSSSSSSQRQKQDDGEREIREAPLYREWGDEENIDYYVLPFYPLALQIKAAAISAFHYAIFLSLSFFLFLAHSMPFQCFMLFIWS
jgi:hypothetical protein